MNRDYDAIGGMAEGSVNSQQRLAAGAIVCALLANATDGFAAWGFAVLAIAYLLSGAP